MSCGGCRVSKGRFRALGKLTTRLRVEKMNVDGPLAMDGRNITIFVINYFHMYKHTKTFFFKHTKT